MRFTLLLFALVAACGAYSADKYILQHVHTACGKDYKHFHEDATGYHIHPEDCEHKVVKPPPFQLTCWDLEGELIQDGYSYSCISNDPLAAHCLCEKVLPREQDK